MHLKQLIHFFPSAVMITPPPCQAVIVKCGQALDYNAVLGSSGLHSGEAATATGGHHSTHTAHHIGHAALLTHFFHHLGHLLVLFKQAVQILDLGTGTRHDALLARPIEKIRIAALGWRH